MSHKYDGSFMQTLSDAVERVFGRWLGDQRRVLGQPGAITGQPDAVRISPTPTEQAEAWRRSHYDEEVEDE